MVIVRPCIRIVQRGASLRTRHHIHTGDGLFVSALRDHCRIVDFLVHLQVFNAFQVVPEFICEVITKCVITNRIICLFQRQVEKIAKPSKHTISLVPVLLSYKIT